MRLKEAFRSPRVRFFFATLALLGLLLIYATILPIATCPDCHGRGILHAVINGPGQKPGDDTFKCLKCKGTGRVTVLERVRNREMVVYEP